MKTFDELTEAQKEKAIDKYMGSLLEDLMTGMLRFSDEKNGDTFQAAVDAACQEAERMRTPWFAHEYIMEARYNPGEGHIVESDGLWPISETIRSLAIPMAEDALYLEGSEFALRLSDL